ncbi:MAG: glycosyl hydrolase family 43 [Herbinix sp.]|jgi:hypothetical protein|nr:glycosyl hydrolase family 43 [Herbinix sp.]
MKTSEIIIRDPFILTYEGKYYMYGTRSFTCWGDNAYGFDVYVSDNLEDWSEPVEVFHRDKDFWATNHFWAPEVHCYEGAFYMFATFDSKDRCKGTAILKADNPLGPFVPHSEQTITPMDWECLDGTLYVSPEGTPYMVFCHEWIQVQDGQVCSVELTKDLKKPVGEPRILFRASQGKPWIRNISVDSPADCYVTDGPFMHRLQNGTLMILWSSFSEEGYTESLAYSDNGDITGNWTVSPDLLFSKDGGHGMIFQTFHHQLMLAVHSPNNSYLEHPVFCPIEENGDSLVRNV